MAEEFRRVITDLWAKLNLARPVFGETETVTLTIDRFELTLRESDDGRHLLIAGTAGRLAADPRLRGEQVRRLLKANLGMLQRNPAGLWVDDSPDAAFVR